MSASEMDDARLLLETILPPPRDGETLEGRFLRTGHAPERRFYADQEALLRDVASVWREQRHCYFGVSLRAGERGDAQGISRAGTLWMDLDDKLWSDEADPAAAALAAVSAFPLLPTAVVSTGGGLHVYLGLRTPYDVQTEGKERLERINAALARAICGERRTPDHTFDAARIFRLPDTFNFKYSPPRPCQIVWCLPQVRYELSAVQTLLAAEYPWALGDASPSPPRSSAPLILPCASPFDLRSKAARGRIRRTTLDLLDSSGPCGYQSSSECDAALAAGLAGAGLSAGEVYTLLRTSTRGHAALERKRGRHGDYYLRVTAQHAADFVGPAASTPLPDVRRERSQPWTARVQTHLTPRR